MSNENENNLFLPWEVIPSDKHHGQYITNQLGETTCDFYFISPSKLKYEFDYAKENSEFVVKAVNNHKKLVEALEYCLPKLHRQATNKHDLNKLKTLLKELK